MEPRDLLKVADARRLARSGDGKRIREACGLSLGEVAAAVGVGAPTVFRWETGERRPTGERALAWRDLLFALDEHVRRSQ